MDWAPLAGVSAYELRRGIASGGPFTTVGTYGAPPVDDLSAAPGQQYYYVVCGVSGELTGPPSTPDAGRRAGEIEIRIDDQPAGQDQTVQDDQPPTADGDGDDVGDQDPGDPPIKVN